ncbi:MAG: MBL fold metallo-hydrolase [Candidatus Yanofskybacteria bacterium]|nr:MBL fold metallo-hydrolase [Candidatus Yanofskybacteria bacterium]
MTLSWLGHSCFRLEGKEVSLLIDPFSKDIGLRAPRIKDQIILVTHDHYDHNNTEGAEAGSMIINGPGEYEVKGVYIQGVPSFHDNINGAERGPNTIYTTKFEEISLCHLGDLGQESLDEKQVDLIGDVDVLMVPVGGKYTIDAKEAVKIIGQIEPKIIIPMHYKTPDLKIDLEPVDKFLKEVGLVPEKMEKFKITQKTLPQEEMKLILLSY